MEGFKVDDVVMSLKNDAPHLIKNQIYRVAHSRDSVEWSLPFNNEGGNVAITFDGETGKLKSVEVLK